jgi:hypothetical protein
MAGLTACPEETWACARESTAGSILAIAGVWKLAADARPELWWRVWRWKVLRNAGRECRELFSVKCEFASIVFGLLEINY